MLVILRSLQNKNNYLPVGALLNTALKQVEFIALHLACAARGSRDKVRHAVYSAAIRHILTAASTPNGLNEAIFKQLKDVALTAISNLPKTLKFGSGATQLLKILYFKNVYNNLPLARAIFLSLESANQNGDGGATKTRGGVVQHFEGSLTLEHILPQVIMCTPLIFLSFFEFFD